MMLFVGLWRWTNHESYCRLIMMIKMMMALLADVDYNDNEIFYEDCKKNNRAGNSLIWFSSESLVFVKKWANELFAQKNERFTHSLIFGERNEWFAHIAHFLWATWGNCSCSLIFGERNEWFTHIAHQKRGNERKWAIHFFLKFLKKP